jgi:hypothetical protein
MTSVEVPAGRMSDREHGLVIHSIRAGGVLYPQTGNRTTQCASHPLIVIPARAMPFLRYSSPRQQIMLAFAKLHTSAAAATDEPGLTNCSVVHGGLRGPRTGSGLSV